jgi:hypothetical protein
MKKRFIAGLVGALVLIALGFIASVSLRVPPERPARAKPTGVIRPQDLADALHAVIAADREVYSRVIVHRLQDEAKVIKTSEHWQEEKALPLPAQMLRLGGEAVQQKGAEFAYVLRSLWPINQKNGPETEVERAGLKFVAEHPQQKYYAEETLGGRRYITAVYPDAATSQSCVTCHNEHPRSPKKDFKLGDVMGGLVIRVPLEF